MDSLSFVSSQLVAQLVSILIQLDLKLIYTLYVSFGLFVRQNPPMFYDYNDSEVVFLFACFLLFSFLLPFNFHLQTSFFFLSSSYHCYSSNHCCYHFPYMLLFSQITAVGTDLSKEKLLTITALNNESCLS